MTFQVSFLDVQWITRERCNEPKMNSEAAGANQTKGSAVRKLSGKESGREFANPFWLGNPVDKASKLLLRKLVNSTSSGLVCRNYFREFPQGLESMHAMFLKGCEHPYIGMQLPNLHNLPP